MSGAKHVRVLYDYEYDAGDACKQVRRGDECTVLCEYDDQWLYVCKLNDTTQHLYVPRQFVQPITASSSQDPPDEAASDPVYASMSRCLSVREACGASTRSAPGRVGRVRAASTPTAAASLPTDCAGVTTSVISEASSDDSREDDQRVELDDDDDDEGRNDYVLFNPLAAAAAGRPSAVELDYCSSTVPACRARRLHSASTQPSTDQLKASH